MQHKEYNTITDFLEDYSFKNWVYQKNLTDINFWESWLQKNSEKKVLVNDAKNILLGISFNKKTVSPEKVNFEWKKLENSIQKKTLHTKNRKYKMQFSIAASILLLISIGLYFTQQNTKINYTTGYGEILNLKLKDGSDVTLNSNSNLYYYKNDSRKVWLSGEAYFKVDKKEVTKAKFFVHTNDLFVEVYGTSFNVNSKKEKTAVFLEEGTIWLSLKNGNQKKMNPGNYISYSAEKNTVLEDKNILNPKTKTSWKDGSILFENIRLEDVTQKIEEVYGYNFIFQEESSKDILITGAIPITNIDICIKAIEKSIGVRITKEKETLIIRRK